MTRAWHVSRDGQVFGPYTDEQLHQMVATNRLLPTDYLHTPPMQEWCEAGSIKGLFPATPVVEAAPAVAGSSQSMQFHCFGCYNESVIEVPAGTCTVQCPHCDTLLEVEQAPLPNEDDYGDPAAFEGVGGDRMEALRERVKEMHEDEARHDGLLGAVIRDVDRR